MQALVATDNDTIWLEAAEILLQQDENYDGYLVLKQDWIWGFGKRTNKRFIGTKQLTSRNSKSIRRISMRKRHRDPQRIFKFYVPWLSGLQATATPP